jgi:hypothetical protein
MVAGWAVAKENRAGTTARHMGQLRALSKPVISSGARR